MNEQRPPNEEPTQQDPSYTEPAQPGGATEGTIEQRTTPPEPATQNDLSKISEPRARE
jgi:hypothetical protein